MHFTVEEGHARSGCSKNNGFTMVEIVRGEAGGHA
jgi:hypothetical protein